MLRETYPPTTCFFDDEQTIADAMIPEGMHNHTKDSTVFLLNRPTNSASPRAVPPPPPRRWRVRIYRYDNQTKAPNPPVWIPLGERWLSLRTQAPAAICLDPTEGSARCREGANGGEGANCGEDNGVGEIKGAGARAGGADGEGSLIVPLHASLQWSALQPDFASLYTPEGICLGVHCASAQERTELGGLVEGVNGSGVGSNDGGVGSNGGVGLYGGEGSSGSRATPPLWALAHVRNRRSRSVRRGSHILSLALCARHRHIACFGPQLEQGLERIFALIDEPPEGSIDESTPEMAETVRSDSTSDWTRQPAQAALPSEQLRRQQGAIRELLKELFDALNSLPLLPTLSSLAPKSNTVSPVAAFPAAAAEPPLTPPLKGGLRGRALAALGPPQPPGDGTVTIGELEWLGRRLTIHATAIHANPELSPQELSGLGSLRWLLALFGGGVLPAHRAMLRGGRVFFFGMSAQAVCHASLSLLLGAPPPLNETMLERCFPYTALDVLEEMERPGGFIAGSTNPLLESRPEWWDVLCDVDSARVRIAKHGRDGKLRAVEPPKLSEADASFLEKVMRAMDEHCSEQALRSHFEAFAQIDADVAECATTTRTRRGFLW